RVGVVPPGDLPVVVPSGRAKGVRSDAVVTGRVARARVGIDGVVVGRRERAPEHLVIVVEGDPREAPVSRHDQVGYQAGRVAPDTARVAQVHNVDRLRAGDLE